MADVIMGEHSLIEQRSTDWCPGCGEDARAGTKALRWESPGWVWGRSFPIQLGFREHLCEIEIHIREPFTHAILPIFHWRKCQCLSFALPPLTSSSSHGIMTMNSRIHELGLTSVTRYSCSLNINLLNVFDFMKSFQKKETPLQFLLLLKCKEAS